MHSLENSNILYASVLFGLENRILLLCIVLIYRHIDDIPPHHYSSEIV